MQWFIEKLSANRRVTESCQIRGRFSLYNFLYVPALKSALERMIPNHILVKYHKSVLLRIPTDIVSRR